MLYMQGSNKYDVKVLSSSDEVYLVQYTISVSKGILRRSRLSYVRGQEFRDGDKEGLVEEIEAAIHKYECNKK